MAINTRKVVGRRKLRFETLAQMRSDVEACIAAERAGRLVRLGNWELGTMLGHLAFWIEAPYENYARVPRPPGVVGLIAKLFRGMILKKGMGAGMKVGRAPGGTYGLETMTTDDGAARLAAAMAKLDAGPPGIPNIVFGPMTHEEWKALNLRHAELHLSFLKPG